MTRRLKEPGGFDPRAVLFGLAALSPTWAASSPHVSGPIAGAAFLGGQDFRVSLSEREYTEEEYFIAGTATSYTSDGPMPADGRMTAKPSDTAAYTTRILVRRPADLKNFNGTVLVEWLNVSAGSDGSPDFSFLHRQIMRDGYMWVGVSAQKVGLDGNPAMPAMAKPVKAANPARYAGLVHPGDAYSFDIFSQAGSIIRGSTSTPAPLRVLRPNHVIAMGESQSAYYLVTYVNAIDPIARVYDGFLIHARGGFAAPLAGMRIDRRDPELFQSSTQFRADLRVPVMNVQSETDVMILGSLSARQADMDRLRLWEIAGASHADTYLLKAAYQDAEGVDPAVLANALAPSTQVFGQILAAPMNSGPQQHYVLNSALDHLNRWVRDGKAPPFAARLAVSQPESHAFALDESGNARGGIRSPWVDAPTGVLSGLGQMGTGFAPLFGTTRPFDAAELAQLYPGGRAQYLERFSAATASAVKQGFILERDEQEINALAAAMYPGNP